MSDEAGIEKKLKTSTEKTVKDNTKKLYPVSNKDIGVIKGDSSESGTNSYAKDNQKTIGNLNKIYKRYKAAKDEGSARTREKGRG